MTDLERVAQRLADAVGDRFAAVHPHAPGTAEHDDAEAAVLARVLGQPDEPPAAYAVKGALGHTLGASGLVSLVVAALCARAGRHPGMPWLANPIAAPGLRIDPAGAALTAGPHAVFAAGFGGAVAAAALGRVPG